MDKLAIRSCCNSTYG